MLIVSDCMLVPVRNNIDVVTSTPLRHHIEALIEGGCKRIILDLNKVDFIDSTGMAMILTVVREMRDRGGLITLINVSDIVVEALTLGCLIPFIPCISKQNAQQSIKPLPAGERPLIRHTMKIDASNLEEARSRLRDLLAQLPLTESEIFDITLAVGEATGNCVLHTPQAMGFVMVSVYNDRLIVEVVDNGPGFEMSPDEEPVVTLEHGRGIKIMRLLCDDVEIKNKAFGHGTVVHLVKLFGPHMEPLEHDLNQVMTA